ncbi:MAG TPA: aminotransferase class I/II-fold pyridoxal phosphate-dependent enzyme [Actinomycetota bacterium]|nr:aminotransferase class I/II-fold pyridoxal phosphate-dependent enzyme [Actinomycetota bacterium]
MDGAEGRRRPGFSTRAIHGAEAPSGELAEQPVSPPLYLTTDWLYEGLEHYADVINERRPGFVYGRYGSPTHAALHRVLASLEGAEAAWSFGSGMSALQVTFTALLGAGDHVVSQRTVYGGTYALLTEVLPRFGVGVSFVEPEAEAVRRALRPTTRAVFLETLANPTARVADVGGVGAVCAERGVALVVDNTVATPYLFRPLEREGVTLSVNSTTKYLGGHADFMGGSVAGGAELVDRLRRLAIELGATAGAFEAWLALRGVQTLALRVDRQCATALELARTLRDHRAVEGVSYPGLPEHPDHGRARALFGGERFGAMLAFSLRGGYEAAVRVCGSLRVARVGSSFGGLRTEVTHPASTSHRQFSPEARRAAGIEDGLVRVAVGGEDPEDLLEDFLQALEKA